MQSKQQKKRRLKIGAWNLRTLLQAGKLENLKEEMRKNKVDVMGISDVRWEQSSELMSTAVEQVVAFARARVRSPVVTCFLGEVFSGFFLTCKTNVRKL